MRVLVVVIACALLIAAGEGSVTSSLTAQSVLPDAPGRETTIQVCGNCHGADTVASVRLTADGWHELITRMVAAGAVGSDQELETVFQYLSTQFPIEAQKPLDLNTASAVELESVGALLRKEAAALIAHRQKNGPCKTIEDLKKVAGLDYKKIEARKERLACL